MHSDRQARSDLLVVHRGTSRQFVCRPRRIRLRRAMHSWLAELRRVFSMQSKMLFTTRPGSAWFIRLPVRPNQSLVRQRQRHLPGFTIVVHGVLVSRFCRTDADGRSIGFLRMLGSSSRRRQRARLPSQYARSHYWKQKDAGVAYWPGRYCDQDGRSGRMALAGA